LSYYYGYYKKSYFPLQELRVNRTAYERQRVLFDLYHNSRDFLFHIVGTFLQFMEYGLFFVKSELQRSVVHICWKTSTSLLSKLEDNMLSVVMDIFMTFVAQLKETTTLGKKGGEKFYVDLNNIIF